MYHLFSMLAVAATVTLYDYQTAYNKAIKNDQPLVVLVGADWCSGCIKMKEQTIPELHNNGTFDNVQFAIVDVESEYETAQKLLRGQSIPQLIKFEKVDGVWKRSQITGFRNVNDTMQFIKSK